MKSFAAIALLATSALARTDLSGCTSYATVASNANGMYGTVIWYVPDTLEVCDFVDCGGGRAPPKSVPGCPLYEGTETITPVFLDHDPAKPKAVKTAEPESSAPETETAATATGESESSGEATVTAPTLTSGPGPEETDSVATATAPDTSTITSMVTSVTTTPSSNSTSSEGGENNDDDAATTSSGTDSPGAAMPTAAVALNVVAGVAAAVAFL